MMTSKFAETKSRNYAEIVHYPILFILWMRKKMDTW